MMDLHVELKNINFKWVLHDLTFFKSSFTKSFFPFEPTIHTTITRTNQPLKDVSLQKQTINEKIKLEHNVDQIYKGYLLFSMTFKNSFKTTPNPQKNFGQQLKAS